MLESEIEDFISAERLERGMAGNTCVSYDADLRLFAKFLGGRGISSAAEIGRQDITEFLQAERENGMAGATRRRRSAAIRMWLRYLKERRQIKSDPSELMDAPKKERLLPKTLSEEEVFAMIDGVAGSDPRSLRDRAMLEVLYGCGLRVSELCDLAMDSIVAEGELFRVLGKGSKARLVPIGGAAGRALSGYLTMARPVFVSGALSATRVVVTPLGRPFTRQGVFKIVRERAAAAGIAADRISPHVLRHCFASHMLAHGADIRAIQELLGHADIGTTQIYTHVDAEKFGDIHRRYHPRA